MSEKKQRNVLAIGFVWLVILGALSAGYKFLLEPYLEGDLISATGSDSQYNAEITLALDAFSGYAVFRSESMGRLLKQRGIKLELEDDGADYESRMKSLKRGKVDLAVFTVDAFLYAGAKLGSYPASIVMAIDETVGADAIVAFKRETPTLQSLDRVQTRIVATPSSPSEFLARTMIATLSLPKLPERWLEEEDGAERVFKRLRTADGEERNFAYVLWEPFVSKALDEDGVHVLLDSSKMKGYIVDVLVANREFIRDHGDLVQATVESYMRAAWSYGQKPGGMVALVQSDAEASGAPLSEEEAKNIADGIQWKNTLENYSHFGVIEDSAIQLDSMEDIIAKVADVLVRTDALEESPVDGNESTLYFRGFLETLQGAGFHPGKKVDILDGVGPTTDDLDEVRSAVELPPLSDKEWTALKTVASMRVESIAFRRGTAEISEFSQAELDALARRFDSLPSYYMRVVGNARKEGDAAANKKLARDRADAVLNYLVERGVDTDRLRAVTGNSSGEAAEVSFVLGQKPY
ncbi:MAG: phosphate ABC transporter substrate-binding/OmpA family protein [Myxococcota bacterium]